MSFGLMRRSAAGESPGERAVLTHKGEQGGFGVEACSSQWDTAVIQWHEEILCQGIMFGCRIIMRSG